MDVDSDEEGKWERELGCVEADMLAGMVNASIAGGIEVQTVYTLEMESSHKPSPTKRARSGGSVTSTKTFKSTKSAATVETRASKKAAGAKAGPETTGLDDDDEDFSL